jgi:hypothetical protein|tara:strand:+ start:278 stop:514 length:237 start_codon:yes stop_codon:yes gene_type:complete
MSNENKKFVVSPENPNGILVDMTTEELAQRDTDIANIEANMTAKATEEQAKEDLKASARAKLVAGEPLTEDEAKTIVL